MEYQPLVITQPVPFPVQANASVRQVGNKLLLRWMPLTRSVLLQGREFSRRSKLCWAATKKNTIEPSVPGQSPWMGPRCNSLLSEHGGHLHPEHKTCPTICTVNLTGAPASWKAASGKETSGRPAAGPKIFDISRSRSFYCNVMWHAAGCLPCATWCHPVMPLTAASRLTSAGAVQRNALGNRPRAC
jgi:hypothetical protein